MTFSNLQPFTHGYGGVVNQSGAVLGQIPKLVEATERRFAGEGLRQAAENKMFENQLKMMKLGAQPQQGQGQQGQGGMDWLGLAQTGLSIAGGLGAFGGGGGGGGANYSPTGAPGFGAENVDWMSMPGYFGNPG